MHIPETANIEGEISRCIGEIQGIRNLLGGRLFCIFQDLQNVDFVNHIRQQFLGRSQTILDMVHHIDITVNVVQQGREIVYDRVRSPAIFKPVNI